MRNKILYSALVHPAVRPSREKEPRITMGNVWCYYRWDKGMAKNYNPRYGKMDGRSGSFRVLFVTKWSSPSTKTVRRIVANLWIILHPLRVVVGEWCRGSFGSLGVYFWILFSRDTKEPRELWQDIKILWKLRWKFRFLGELPLANELYIYLVFHRDIQTQHT